MASDFQQAVQTELDHAYAKHGGVMSIPVKLITAIASGLHATVSNDARVYQITGLHESGDLLLSHPSRTRAMQIPAALVDICVSTPPTQEREK